MQSQNKEAAFTSEFKVMSPEMINSHNQQEDILTHAYVRVNSPELFISPLILPDGESSQLDYLCQRRILN